jgi:putative transposon-encoded protein
MMINMARSRRAKQNRNKKNISNFLPVMRGNQYMGNKSKFEVYGEEMIEKEVKQSGNSGRVYLPPDWIGKHVKIIRID